MEAKQGDSLVIKFLLLYFCIVNGNQSTDRQVVFSTERRVYNCSQSCHRGIVQG